MIGRTIVLQGFCACSMNRSRVEDRRTSYPRSPESLSMYSYEGKEPIESQLHCLDVKYHDGGCQIKLLYAK
jgi:hypothetical protein